MGEFNFAEELKKMPQTPGVYLMHDAHDDVIYVGKAVNLKRRVSSYFRKSTKRTTKIESMVSKIRRFEYILTDSELEALILECNLIKEYRPKYNTMLMDDKTYPYVMITVSEDYPRIVLARRMKKDNNKYFGPFTSSAAVKDTIDLLQKMYQIRSCNKAIVSDGTYTADGEYKNIPKINGRPCLYYHIGQCKGPCQGYISKEDYRENINKAIKFLEGNYTQTIKELEEKGIGHEKVNYKLRDWVFSRQRYWGEPIPLVHCDKCGWVPLPEDQLPLLLPEVESYEPTDNGESPLAAMTDWVNTTCPCCGGPAKRETDTMPQWAGSSWYYLRYMDPHNDKALASKEALEYWGQVDWYNGGMEHTTLHLLYSRFWNNFLHDIGVIPCAEPYAKRTSHGMILGKNPHYVGNVETEEEKQALIEKYGNQALRPSVKMSKSLGNVVNPDDVIRDYGADTMRLYIMFIGDFEKAAAWSDNAVKGCKRFLDRVWNLAENLTEEAGCSKANESAVHKTIKKVSDDIEAMKFNTAIAALMSLVNDFYANGASRGDMKALLLMLSPFAPHMCEELWEMAGYSGQVCLQAWPEYDESKTVAATTQMAVQVSGKVKANIVVPTDASDEAIVSAALADPKVAKLAEGKELVKSIVVKGKLVSLIFKPKA